MLHLQNLTVLILGLGDSGLAMARWCAQCGAQVRVADTREAPPQAATLAQDVPAASLHHGLSVSLLDGVNVLFKSPGLAPNAADVSALLAAADERGIPVRGELSLFASALADLKQTRRYAPKVLAITGTNGKTTTTSLTAQLVERTGKRVGLAGNIGPTLLDTLRIALAQEPEEAQASLDLQAAEAMVSEAAEVVPEVCDASSVVPEGPADAELAVQDQTEPSPEAAESAEVGAEPANLDDDADAPSHAEKAHQHHDAEGDEELDHELVDRLPDIDRLIRDFGQAHPQRHFRVDRRRFSRQRATAFNRVAEGR